MTYEPGDMVIIRWPTRLDPNGTVTARLLSTVPETRRVDWKGREFTVGRGWCARVIAPGGPMDQWLIGHVDEMCIARHA